MPTTSDSLRLGWSRETVPGVTDTNPEFLPIRTTGEGLAFSFNSTASNEIGGTGRGTKDSIITGATSGGGINFELAQSEAFEDLLACFQGSEWEGNSVVMGEKLMTGTVEKRLTTDPSAEPPGYSYQVYTGNVVDTFALSIQPNNPITGSFGLVGQTMELSNDAIPGETWGELSTFPVMTAPKVSNISLIDANGVEYPWIAEACFTNFGINLSNNSRGVQCIGVLGNKETLLGTQSGTIDVGILYSGNESLELMVEQEEFAVSVTTEDTANPVHKYTFYFPRCKFTALTAPAAGPNEDVTATGTISILQGPEATPYMMKVTRAPGVAFPPTGLALKSGSAIEYVFTPEGATVPADLTALQALGALGQTTAWTTGQFVALADATQAHWDGAAWIAGPAA